MKQPPSSQSPVVAPHSRIASTGRRETGLRGGIRRLFVALVALLVLGGASEAFGAAPVVTFILPANGATAGGTAVTIVGSGFTAATAVSIGGTAVPSFTIINDTMIDATTAAHAAGAANVVVTNSTGPSTGGTGLYTYGAAPIAAGVGWTDRTSAGSRSWISIVSSADGGKLAAVAGDGDIYTSTDSGATWTDRTSGNSGWGTITSSADGTKLAAEGPNSDIWTSTDSGATWTDRTGSGSRAWASITSSADGTKLAAVDQAVGDIYTSTDGGATWTDRASAGSRNWISVASSADGSKLAAADQAVGEIYTSTDAGATWTNRISAGTRHWQSITSSADGSKLAAAVWLSNSGTPGDIWTSTDSGATWTDRTSAGSRYWSFITSSADGSKLTATNSASTTGDIYTSTDGGATWTDRIGAGSRKWSPIASSADGSKLAAVDQGGNIWTSVGGVATAPVVTDPTSASIATTGAVLGGNVISDSGATITERGVVYSVTATNNHPTIGGMGVTKVTATGTTGVFTVNSGTLAIATSYSFAAYATNAVGTAYATPVSLFTTRGPAAIAFVIPPNGATAGGTTVTIVGSNFASATAVSIGGAAVTHFTIINDTMIDATTAAGAAGAANVAVTNSYGSSTGGTGLYTYGAAPIPAGAAWTDRTSAGTQSWWSITSSADGSKLAAVAEEGDIYTSTDSGATWTDQTTAGARTWEAITSSADGSKLAAVDIGFGHGGDIYTSTDGGATWTDQTSSGSHPWASIASSADGSKLAAGTFQGNDIYTSTDCGATWTERTGEGHG